MYHHVNSDRCSNDLEMFENHLLYIKDHFHTVLPNEEILGDSICLTFDDAYSDFYFLIYPLLKKYNLKALLAIPTKYILDSCNLSAETRMGFEHKDFFQNYEKGTFCTYSEIQEMLHSGLVGIASHSHSHVNLEKNGVNVEEELKLSKTILEEKLKITIDSFVFPYGKYNKEILSLTKKHYSYIFRIGNAIHNDFEGINGVIYRIDGDGITRADEIFGWKKMAAYRLKAFIKKVTNG